MRGAANTTASLRAGVIRAVIVVGFARADVGERDALVRGGIGSVAGVAHAAHDVHANALGTVLRQGRGASGVQQG